MAESRSLKSLPSDLNVNRIPSLDALRGIAILMVIFGHFIPIRIALGDASYHVSSLGRGGVVLFFLLSGYLVFRNIEKQDTITFISRRLFKIFPAYWVNVLLITFFSFLLGKEVFPPDVLLGNFFMVQDIFRKESLSGVYWTLLIEVKFYLFLALQHFLLRDRSILVVLAALICVNLAVWFARGHASLLLTFFPAFYVGILVRQAEAAGWSRSAMLPVAGVTLVNAASLLVFDEYYGESSAIYVISEAIMLIAFLRMGVSNSILGFFGRISYSHYLYHTAAGYLFLALFPPSDVLAFNLLIVALVIVLTTAIAFISYRLVEVPLVAFGKKHEYLWIRRRERTVP
ncbi:peptidoglycan/LPS O-acetylase OafA/YrhL [Afipia massiliensis]|uniref:Peptidoglycan/LPS O-acetylase OafA/YrhL n=1 Tax=Afipia massiliensis TaxID=211460 RepID=A0A840N6K1_9BRAD|nr:acyltransferase [Afipia massiliensis]MBB5054207.1 peptidoglycan/LPS O-acetylase OafA/YrhL [Afipia massiliensis]